MSNATNTSESFVYGGTHGADTRGTYDIVWTSVQTIFLCSWVSVCVNIPAPNFGSWDIWRDKFHFVLVTVLGPELTFLLAFGQYQSARTSLRMFQESGFDSWTLSHAFYADMGGIHVQPESWERFPVNAKQLHYLVTHGYMDYPEISKEEIRCRGKADYVTRFITIGQTIFFTTTTFCRYGQGLAVTTLELTVLGFILCTLLIYVCWWNKPNDVELGHVFKLKDGVTVEKILIDAGDEAREIYRDTPLDFLHEGWVCSKMWKYYVNILRQLHLFPAQHTSRPLQRFSSFNWPIIPSRKGVMVPYILALIYAGTFFAAWNYEFPTRTERTLWRVVTCAQYGIVVVAGGFEILYYEKPSCGRERIANMDLSHLEKALKQQPKRVLSTLWNMPCNNTMGKPPSADVPLRSLLITTPVCAAYCCCRWLLLFEDVFCLRALPASTYQDVDWTKYWPTLWG